MPYVNTTFLPKTNGLVFADRLVARSDKGRVFGLGVTTSPLAVDSSVAWVTPEPFLVSEDVDATTATFLNVEAGDIFRYRIQTRDLTTKASLINGPWTTYDGTQQTVTVTLPNDDTLEVRFQSQGKEAPDNTLVTSSTGWRAITPVTSP